MGNSKFGKRAVEGEVDFLKTEVDTGLTFARLASGARYSDKKDRNQANARKAYDTVLHWTRRVSLAAPDSQEIGDKLVQLRAALEDLGESV